MDWKTHLKQQIELGKELGRQKRIEHNEKVKKFFKFGKKKEKEEKENEDDKKP